METSRIVSFYEKTHIPFDVIKYIYLTFHGKFWDYTLKKHKSNDFISKKAFKILMFKEIFYSNILYEGAKPYAVLFKKDFPQVYRFITDHIKLKKENDEITV